MNVARHGAIQQGCRTTTHVPWMTRVQVHRPSPARVLPRLALTLGLALALNTIALAQSEPGKPEETAPAAESSAIVPDLSPVLLPPTATAPAPPTPRATPAPAAAVHVAPLPSAPTDLRDVSAWVAYKTARHLPSMPIEARLFYRRALTVKESGADEQALALARGASELDPSYLEPHLTLAAWLLVPEPSQALLQYASALEIVRQDFNLQVEIATNALLFLLRALFAGMLGAALIVVALRQGTLRHPWVEWLSRSFSPGSARAWSWGMLLLPFAAGFGLALPAVLFLGLSWPELRLRERLLFVMLTLVVVLAPLTRTVLDRMALPLREDRGPFYGVPMLENQPYSRARQERFATLANEKPSDPFVEFGLAWTARRGGDLATAEAAYRRALEAWPADDRLLNNLGNVLAMQGRGTEALALYQKAEAANPKNAAPYFNASQIYTQRYEYQAASEAIARASALNFELVKDTQAQGTNDGVLPLVDQWLSPRAFWRALWEAPAPGGPTGALPVVLRRHIEASGWAFSLLTLVTAAFALFAGTWQWSRLPLRACSNCGRIVCRRCSERRREHAYCADCAAIESRAETQDFSRVLLLQHRQKHRRLANLARTACAAIVPGFGLLAHRRLFSAIVLIAATWSIASAWVGQTSPFAVEPRLALAADEMPPGVLATMLGFVYLVSLAGYFGLVRKEREREATLQAAQRGRITQATRRNAPIAA